MYKGEVSTFRVYDRALDAGEVDEVSTDADADIHAASSAAAQTIVDGVAAVTVDELARASRLRGPGDWSSNDAGLAIGDDGRSPRGRAARSG